MFHNATLTVGNNGAEYTTCDMKSRRSKRIIHVPARYALPTMQRRYDNLVYHDKQRYPMFTTTLTCTPDTVPTIQARNRMHKERTCVPHPNTPTKFKTPYIVFCLYWRSIVARELKSLRGKRVTSRTVTQELARQWHKLNAVQRMPYVCESDEDYNRWVSEKNTLDAVRGKRIQSHYAQNTIMYKTFRVRSDNTELYFPMEIAMPTTFEKVCQQVRVTLGDDRHVVALIHSVDRVRLVLPQDFAQCHHDTALNVVWGERL